MAFRLRLYSLYSQYSKLIVAIAIRFSDRWKELPVSSGCFPTQSVEDFNLLLDVLPQAVGVLHPELLDVGKIETDIVFCYADTVVVQQDEIFLRQLLPLVQSHQKADFVVDVLVAQSQVCDQQTTFFDQLQNFVVDFIRKTGIKLVDANFA